MFAWSNGFRCRIGRDDLLGCCVLGPESPTKDGREQWEQCFAGMRGMDGAPLLSHSVSCSVTAGDREPVEHLLGVGDNQQRPRSTTDLCNGGQLDDLCDEMERLTPAYRSLENGCSKSAPPTAKISTVSGMNGDTTAEGIPRPIAVWHSIDGELPESFRNIPKAKKK